MATFEVTATTTDRARRVVEVEDVADAEAAIQAAIEHLTTVTAFDEPWTAGDVERGVFAARASGVTAEPGDKCANPKCGHVRLVHQLHGRCESLNTITPCRCEAFVEPAPAVEVER